MKSTIKALAALAAMFFMAQATQATTAQCNSCNEGQMQAKAKSLGAGSSPHIIWNPSNGEVRRYRVYCGSAPNAVGGSTKTVAMPKAGCNFLTEDLRQSGQGRGAFLRRQVGQAAEPGLRLGRG